MSGAMAARRQSGKSSPRPKHKETQKEKGKDGKMKKDGKDGALKRSFDAMSHGNTAAPAAAAAAAATETVTKASQSLFVTYLKSTAGPKDPGATNQAAQVLQDYKQMTGDQKRSMVSNFFELEERNKGYHDGRVFIRSWC